MSAAVAMSPVAMRHQEIQALLASNDSSTASRRLLDFVKDFSEDRAVVHEAIVVSQNVSAWRDDERRNGSTAETTRTGNILTTRMLELVDKVAAGSSAPVAAPMGPRLVKEEEDDRPTDDGAPEKVLPFDKALEAFKERKRTPVRAELVFSCRGISRGYRGNSTFKLRGVDLELALGSITGLVGANAAGKTTLLRMIAGELSPDEGTALYPLLQPGAEHPRELDWQLVRTQIAYVRQHPYRCFGRVQDILHREAALHGLYKDENKLEVEFLLQRLGLDRFKSARWGELSGGYRMRFELAKALISRPKLLVLDEPLAPLDVDSQLLFLQDLKCLATSARRPIAVIISSQHLYETEAISDQLLFLKDGEPEFCGATKDLGTDRALNCFELGTPAERAQVDRALGAIIKSCEQTSIGMYFIHAERSTASGDILKALVEKRVEVSYFRDVSSSARSLFDSAKVRS